MQNDMWRLALGLIERSSATVIQCTICEERELQELSTFEVWKCFVFVWGISLLEQSTVNLKETAEETRLDNWSKKDLSWWPSGRFEWRQQYRREYPQEFLDASSSRSDGLTFVL